MTTSLPRLLLAILAFAAPEAWPGAQKYEVLSASVRASLAQAVNDRGTIDWTDMETRVWVRAMTKKARRYFPDDKSAHDFLGLVHYEARRAGLDPLMVLSVIEVESRFRKYAVSSAGARGYMQVMPFWAKELNAEKTNLFSERSNLRFGCTILRHYLDRESGNTSNALGRYNGSLGNADYPNRVMRAYRTRWSLEVM